MKQEKKILIDVGGEKIRIKTNGTIIDKQITENELKEIIKNSNCDTALISYNAHINFDKQIILGKSCNELFKNLTREEIIEKYNLPENTIIMNDGEAHALSFDLKPADYPFLNIASGTNIGMALLLKENSFYRENDCNLELYNIVKFVFVYGRNHVENAQQKNYDIALSNLLNLTKYLVLYFEKEKGISIKTVGITGGLANTIYKKDKINFKNKVDEVEKMYGYSIKLDNIDNPNNVFIGLEKKL